MGNIALRTLQFSNVFHEVCYHERTRVTRHTSINKLDIYVELLSLCKMTQRRRGLNRHTRIHLRAILVASKIEQLS